MRTPGSRSSRSPVIGAHCTISAEASAAASAMSSAEREAAWRTRKPAAVSASSAAVPGRSLSVITTRSSEVMGKRYSI